ncbi:hypothetical protein K443DRAFT_679316 [Laccaria amethystina LaAM-08-1]|uniref:DUF6535 domain-containing protein n=1 Tax=Laccaria amethystina LaAM-08-1 TaxID=1095629 RepID=A0A0C9X5B0_9AGAR|nr:hypothetical protein K443DRAFT_679316 [Laccaria amethystina LaAM-08-1]
MLPSSVDTTNVLLAQLIALQDNNTRTSPSTLLSSLPQIASPTVREIHWVNGLWFAALACSLSAALVSMLAKQWLVPPAYESGSHRYRARQRQARYTQLEVWHVFALINGLPLLLHAALLLFFAGLIVLLWSGDTSIMATTFVIVALAYTFYFGSMWLSLLYPYCPYQHPISAHIRKWMMKPSSFFLIHKDVGAGSKEVLRYPVAIQHPVEEVDPHDRVDTAALIWMLHRCTNTEACSAAVQAMAGLPRDFTASHILREAGSVDTILRQFQICFQMDSTHEAQWHVVDPRSAEKYCRAWMNLTRGTGHKWPRALFEPLQKLIDQDSDMDVAAIASCTMALAAMHNRCTQMGVITHLEHFANGDRQYRQATQCWLLGTFVDCSLNWELGAAVIEDITSKAVPILLRLFKSAKGASMADVRCAIVLALSSVTGGIRNLDTLKSEESRRERYFELIIPALSILVQDPKRFGIKEDLLEMAACELSRLASPTFFKAQVFQPALKNVIRQSLSKLYADGRIRIGLVSDDILADALQILFPPMEICWQKRTQFVAILLDTLSASSHPGVVNWSVRLLEPLMVDSSPSVVQAFVDGNGINVLLRAAHTGDTDSRPLQLNCLRTLCIFIRSSAGVFLRKEYHDQKQAEAQVDQIFHSDFFNTLLAFVSVRRWWLPEIVDIWLPSLVSLCQIRPSDPIWGTTYAIFQKFADGNEGEDGCSRLLSDLKTIRDLHDAGATTTEPCNQKDQEDCDRRTDPQSVTSSRLQ